MSEKNAIDIAKSINDMDELFHIAKNLEKERTEEFLKHYKKHSKKDKAEKKIHSLLKKSKSHQHLLNLIKKDLIRTIKKDAIKAKKSLRKDDSTDSYIKQLKLSTLPSKIKLFEATFDKKDFHKIKKILDSVV